MKKHIPCAFGKKVLNCLIDRGMTQNDLIVQIRNSTGLFVDSAYMSKIITGQRNAPKIVFAIREILSLPDEMLDRA